MGPAARRLPGWLHQVRDTEHRWDADSPIMTAVIVGLALALVLVAGAFSALGMYVEHNS
jgi:hypothetical protein